MLLAGITQTVQTAMTLPEDDLSADVVAGFGTSHVSIDGVSSYLSAAKDVVDKGTALYGQVPAPGELVDKLGAGAMENVGGALSGADAPGVADLTQQASETAEDLL